MTTLDDFGDKPRWLAWRNENRDGKVTKVPYAPQGGKAKANDPKTWSTREAAERMAGRIANGSGGGVGIMLGDLGDGTVLGGIDLDACVGDDGASTAWADAILAAVPSYAERSPSGKGIKLYFRLPTEMARPFLDRIGVQADAFGCRRSPLGENGTNHGPAVELYFGGRYFALTGDRWPTAPDDIALIEQTALERLAEAIPNKPTPAAPSTTRGKGEGDNSRSAAAFRLGKRMAASGKTYAEFAAAVSTDPEIAAWHDEKGTRYDDRELKRIWEKVAVPRPIELIRYEDLTPRLDSRPLVKGILEREQTSLMFGDAGTGKTFLALDIGLHVAAGRDWAGRRVAAGGVVYVAAEAGRSIANRVAAWRQEYGLDILPFAAVTSPVDLCHANSGDLGRLIAAIEAEGLDLALVVIDTVSRVMAGGNENAPDDMGALVRALDQLRDELRCHVLAVHHRGKDPKKGGRGHSLLHCAVDTEVEVSRGKAGDIFFASVNKQRDGAAGGYVAFRLESVHLGEDGDGEPVTSCVVRPVAGASPSKPASTLPAKAKLALELLTIEIEKNGEVPPQADAIPANTRCVAESVWREACYSGGISGSDKPEAKQKAFKRAEADLLDAVRIGVWQEWRRVVA
jgi:hypothetical protein